MENNIHSFPGLAKGKQAPLDRKSVSFAPFLKVLPNAPLIDEAPNYSYPMDGNDRVGCCVVAGWDHSRQVITGLLCNNQRNYTQDEIWAFYKTQNPDFDPNGTSSTNGPGSNADRGMNIQLFLEYLVSKGYILGFAKIDHTNPTELQAAIYIGLSVITGVVLDNIQMQQYYDGTWDYVPGSPVDGGHCIPQVGYDNNARVTCVTWAKLVKQTASFINHQMDEAWFILMQEHVDHPSFRNYFDLKGFADAVYQITGGKVIVPVPTPIPPADPIPYGTTLKLTTPFTKGPNVTILQHYLIRNGATMKADGVFGPATKAAVVAFQKAHNLTPDGIVGKATWTAFDMIEVITGVCNQNGIELLLGVSVATCESLLNPKGILYNAQSNSYDRGLFQWNNVYHPEISDAQAYDPKIATQLFCNAVKAGKLHQYWSASQPCWKKKLTPEIIAKYGIV